MASKVGMAQDRYAVFFKYKPQQEFSLANPSKYLTNKAIQRREREKVSVDSLDLPVASFYMQGLRAHSQEILYVSKWLNAAVVVADSVGKKGMEALPYVQKVQWVAKGFISKTGNKVVGEERTAPSKKWAVEESYREAAAYDFQNQLLGIPDMHQAGFTGKGVIVAIFDSGFPGLEKAPAFSHLFTNKQVLGQLNVVRPWIKEVFRDHEHGTQVSSLILANQVGTLVSGAHQAQVIFAITEDVATEYPLEEFNWVRAAEYADSLGVDIINSSLGNLDFDEPKLTYITAQLD
ncbi:MAG: S8 family serine peptidase, partial [Algoriphagus sp.]